MIEQSWESLIFPLMTGLGSEALKSTLCYLLLAQGFVSQAFKNKLDSRSVNLCCHGKGWKVDSVASIFVFDLVVQRRLGQTLKQMLAFYVEWYVFHALA